MIAGLVLALAGAALLLAGRFNLPLGRLPGDLSFHGKNYSFYFPLATSIVLSLLFTLVLWLLNRR